MLVMESKREEQAHLLHWVSFLIMVKIHLVLYTPSFLLGCDAISVFFGLNMFLYAMQSGTNYVYFGLLFSVTVIEV